MQIHMNMQINKKRSNNPREKWSKNLIKGNTGHSYAYEKMLNLTPY